VQSSGTDYPKAYVPSTTVIAANDNGVSLSGTALLPHHPIPWTLIRIAYVEGRHQQLHQSSPIGILVNKIAFFHFPFDVTRCTKNIKLSMVKGGNDGGGRLQDTSRSIYADASTLISHLPTRGWLSQLFITLRSTRATLPSSPGPPPEAHSRADPSGPGLVADRRPRHLELKGGVGGGGLRQKGHLLGP
jgi:hypothetical protein